MPDVVPHMACGICGLVLNRHRENGRISWEHTEDSDHVTVPVLVSEIRTNFVCDFCLADNARWLLPVSRYEIVPGSLNEGDWTACDACAGLLRGNRWGLLIDRALQAYKVRNRVDWVDRATFSMIYEQVQAHVTGPVRLRVDEATPPEAASPFRRP